MKSFRDMLLIYMLFIGIILILVFINLLYTQYDNNKLLDKYNVSQDEQLIKCLNGTYEIISNHSLFVCGKVINKDYVIS